MYFNAFKVVLIEFVAAAKSVAGKAMVCLLHAVVYRPNTPRPSTRSCVNIESENITLEIQHDTCTGSCITGQLNRGVQPEVLQ